MLVSAWMYALTGVFIVFGGGLIISILNAVSAAVFTSLPENAPEGKFWLALASTMLALIAYASRAAYLDLRRNGRFVWILLLAKLCSSSLFLAFFFLEGPLVYFAAFCTDIPLLVFTFALWLPVTTVDDWIGCTDEDIIAAIGEATFPRGGAFEVGYSDVREECLEDVRRMFAGYSPWVLIGIKAMLRLFDWSPLLLLFAPRTLRNLRLADRQKVLQKLEQHWFFGFRMMVMAAKMFIAMPFFNRNAAAESVGAFIEPDE
jgi:hypothetical protein